MKRALPFATLLILIAITGYLLADYYQGPPADAVATYIGRDNCATCHQEQVELFIGSHHDQAMDIATPESVKADFDDQSLEHYGITSRMFRDGDRYMVNTEGPDGKMQDFEVKYTFGTEPLQQFMVELDRGRVQVLRLSWDTVAKKWFYLSPPDVDEKLDPTDPLHWTGVTQNWNVSCAECHSTNLQKNFDIATVSWNTSWSEIDVSCEACHGPASLHEEIASSKGLFWDRHHGKGLTKLKTTNNLDQIQACAPCHSRRTVTATNYKPGCNFDDYHALQLATEPLYFADGQIRDEDYVHGSFLQSKMFHSGIKCSDCHDPHSLKLKHDGNQVCTSCHQHPTGKYDTKAHHFHEPGTAGAACVNCHMPTTTYMAVDHRRDHSFRVPRPDLSTLNGTPNSCTQCHLELEPKTEQQKQYAQYLDWIIAAENGDAAAKETLERVNQQMATATAKWYPAETSPPKTAYYPELAEAQRKIRDSEPATETLSKLAFDAANPAIIRATAAQLLATQTDEKALDVANRLVTDPDIKVAVAAIASTENLLLNALNQQLYSASEMKLESGMIAKALSLVSLLDDDRARVRMEAARALTSLPENIRYSLLNTERRSKFETAIREYCQSLMVMSDTAGAHMMLGNIHERLGQAEQAADDYRKAIEIEPYLAGPRSNLAALLDNKIRSLQMQLQNPSGSGAGVSAGQFKAVSEQMARLQKRIDELRSEDHQRLAVDLKRAASLPNAHALHYRFAMSAYLQRDMNDTEKHMKIAYEQQPDNPRYAMGLATFYLQMNDAKKAVPFVEQLLDISPDDPGYQALKRQLDSMR
jgi:tetratricopeptide (TPR) repeat protein